MSLYFKSGVNIFFYKLQLCPNLVQTLPVAPWFYFQGFELNNNQVWLLSLRQLKADGNFSFLKKFYNGREIPYTAVFLLIQDKD